MKLNIGKIILISLLATQAGFIFGESAGMSGESQKKIDDFLKAETAEARGMLSAFPTTLLEEYAASHRASLTPAESRKLWIIEEYYKRKGDQIASDRLFYVFLAIVLLIALIFGLVFKTWQMQRNLEKMD